MERYSEEQDDQVGKDWDIRPLSEIQSLFAQADDELGEAFKGKYPTWMWDDIKTMYPTRWIAILPCEVGAGLKIIRGRLIADADDKAQMEQKLQQLKTEYPNILPTVHFMKDYQIYISTSEVE